MMSLAEISPPTNVRQRLCDLSRARLRYAPTVEILDLWLSGYTDTPDARIPGFDPIDAASLLGFLYILERDGARMRYRVSGESVNTLFGSSHTGKYLDEVVPEAVYPIVEPFFLDVFRRKVCIFKGHVILSSKRLTEFERLLLPVERGGGIQILGTLAMSTSAPLRTDIPAPARADLGFHFTQIDLTSGDMTETAIPITDLPVDSLPFEAHVKRRGPDRSDYPSGRSNRF